MICRKYFTFSVCVWLSVFVKWSLGECNRISIPGNDVVGVMIPVYDKGTDCHSLNMRGVLMAEAFLYSLKEVNNKQLLQSGRRIGVEIRSSCNDSFRSAFELLTVRSPLAVIGKLPQDNDRAIRLFDISKIPYLSCNPSTYHKGRQLNKNGEFVFHVHPTDRSNIGAILSFIESFNWTHVGVVADDNDVGKFILDIFSKEAEKKNICIGGQFLFPTHENQNGISSFIDSLKTGTNFSVVILLSSEGVSEVIIDSAYKQKLTGINWIAGQESWDKTTSVSKENNAARGMFQIGPTAKLLPFKEHLRNITRGPIKNVWLCQLLSSGHPKNTSNSTSKSHCDCTSGLPSNARKEFVDDIINKLVSMAESEACVIDAAYAIAFAYNAKANCKSECPEFIEYLQQVSFTSKTGHKVSFDDQKNLKEKEFHFYNYQNKVPMTVNDKKYLYPVDVGTWRKSDSKEAEMKLQLSRIEWNGGSVPKSRCQKLCPPGNFLSFNSNRAKGECCWQCLPCPEGTMNKETDSRFCNKCDEHWRPNEKKTKCTLYFEDYVYWDHPAALVMIFLMTAGVAFSFYLMITMVKHNDSPVVKNSRNAILFLLPFLIIMFLLPVPLLGRPTKTTCEAYRGFFIVIIGTPLAILIAKSQTVREAFYDENGRAKVNWQLCTPRFLIVLLLMILHIIFVIVVASVLPAEVYRFPTDDPFVEYLECSTHSTFQMLIAVIYVFILAVIVSVLSLNEILSETNHNEVKWISMCMFNFYAITFFYLVCTFRFHEKGKIVALTFMCLLYAINYLGCMFVPKWYIIVFRPEQNQSDVSPFDMYQKSREKISERLCHQEDSPLALRRSASSSSAKGADDDERETRPSERKELISDTDL